MTQTICDPKLLLDTLAHRRSMGLSRLKPDPVDRHLIEMMLEAANWAPSNDDTEPWRFTVYSGDGREALAEIWAASQEHEGGKEGARKRAYAAPVWISIEVEPKLDEDGNLVGVPEEELMAVSCAVNNMHLMASTLGLAGMWHSKGLSVDPKVAEGLGLTGHKRLLGFFMLGWPNIEWPEGSRVPITQKVKWVGQ